MKDALALQTGKKKIKRKKARFRNRAPFPVG